MGAVLDTDREAAEVLLWGSGWAIQCFGNNMAENCQELADRIPSATWVDLEAKTANAPVESEQEDDVPIQWTNALKKADRYANNQQMSKSRLFRQLTSEYGEAFPEDAAQYAVDHFDVDWNANALQKARNYQDRQAMSVDRIYRQLTSEYGEGFTAEEAQYAVDNL